MATVARLHPRHWDGRRLLQFLTGLALIALAFAVPTLSPAPEVSEPAPVVTVVDAPAPGEVSEAPAVQAVEPASGSVAAVDSPAAVCEFAVLHSGADQRTVAGRAPPAA
ncbi:hypothetical protein [Symbioplanes lichenis]|uniref:hypothetical protein n=1 Tax=Symbioplanes lichenis TaxID=1629072 RepID=UPI00273A57D4|nr:hypothetical protein [Actinoplanes lichenis]